MNLAWCAECGDGFAPVEYRPADLDSPNFCSDTCQEAWDRAEDATAHYNL